MKPYISRNGTHLILLPSRIERDEGSSPASIPIEVVPLPGLAALGSVRVQLQITQAEQFQKVTSRPQLVCLNFQRKQKCL